MTERFQNEHPDCRCACFEWSVWSGLGMGQNLGRVEALLQHGVTAIPPDEGARLFCDLLADRELPTSIVVTGRFGTPPTLRFALPDLPRLRFLGNVRIQSPVEIVCDVALSAESDPYVNEHALQGQRLFPAVVALEAMAQVAMALVGEHSPPVFENARFSRPLVVPAKGSATIRIQALRREPDRVDVALLSEETGFAVRHFEVTCSWSSSGTVFQPVDREPGCQPGLPSDGTPPQDNRQDACFIADRLEACPTAAPLLPIQIADDLYEPRLFHTGRFRRVRGYRALSARECVAVISPPTREDWFGANLSPTRLLGDLAGRDAALHAIQACVPHRRVLPIGLARMRIAPAQPPGARIVFANERARTADEFEYDVLVKDESGSVLESWEGLRLRAVAPIAAGAPWAAPLLAPFLERELNDLFDDLSIKVALIAGAERKLRSSAAFAAMGVSEVAHRLDGKPEAENAHVSAAHCGDLTLAVRSDSRIACDLEAIAPATKWTNLFTKAQHRLAETIVGETAEDFATAATRVWVATECLKKAGIAIAPTLPLMLDSGCETRDAGWLGFRAGSARVLTCRAAVRGANAPLVCAICVPSVESTYSVPSLPSAPPAAPKIFEYRHVVTFEDSNVVGNVYFVNHLSWQGRCREMFLRTHAPEAIRQLDAAGLSLATSSVACEFFEELFPFDEVVIRMTLRELTTSTAALVFDYLRQRGDTLTLIARGQHTVAVKRKAGIPPTSAPAVFTAELQAALESYLPAP
jgi:enediyne polyketide synthase